MTSDITVNLSGTWSAKQRQNNGLDLVAGFIRRQWKAGHQVPRIPVVAFIEYHNWQEPLSGPKLDVSIPVIEPVLEADGSDPNGYGQQIMDLLDQLRKQRGKGSVEDVPSRAAGEIEGQGAFDFGDPDEGGDEPVDVNASGEPVPPPSGEEVVAELDERRAATAKASVIDATTKLAAKDKAAKKAPAATFTGGDA